MALYRVTQSNQLRVQVGEQPAMEAIPVAMVSDLIEVAACTGGYTASNGGDCISHGSVSHESLGHESFNHDSSSRGISNQISFSHEPESYEPVWSDLI